jgi:hypothetical protein
LSHPPMPARDPPPPDHPPPPLQYVLLSMAAQLRRGPLVARVPGATRRPPTWYVPFGRWPAPGFVGRRAVRHPTRVAYPWSLPQRAHCGGHRSRGTSPTRPLAWYVEGIVLWARLVWQATKWTLLPEAIPPPAPGTGNVFAVPADLVSGTALPPGSGFGLLTSGGYLGACPAKDVTVSDWQLLSPSSVVRCVAPPTPRPLAIPRPRRWHAWPHCCSGCASRGRPAPFSTTRVCVFSTCASFPRPGRFRRPRRSPAAPWWVAAILTRGPVSRRCLPTIALPTKTSAAV